MVSRAGLVASMPILDDAREQMRPKQASHVKGTPGIGHCSPNTLSYVSRIVRNMRGKTICQMKKKERKKGEGGREGGKEGGRGHKPTKSTRNAIISPTGSSGRHQKVNLLGRILRYVPLTQFTCRHRQRKE